MHVQTTPNWLIATALVALVMSSCSKDTADHPLAGTPQSNTAQSQSAASSQASSDGTDTGEFNVPPAQDASQSQTTDPSPSKTNEGPSNEASGTSPDQASPIPGFPGPIKSAQWQTSPTRLDMVVGPLPAEWTPIHERTSSMEKIAFRAFTAEGGVWARLSVFRFPEAPGNTVDANIRRWRSQFRTDSGEPGKAHKLTLTTVGNLDVTIVGLQGNYTAMGATVPQADQRMLTAMIKTDSGTEFIRLLGPTNAVEAAADRYRWLIQNLVLVPTEEELERDSE